MRKTYVKYFSTDVRDTYPEPAESDRMRKLSWMVREVQRRN